MPDPPVHHDPPPFTAEDIRISPSGPYVPGLGSGGAIIRFGADAVVETFEMSETDAGSQPINRTTGTPHPLAVTFPAFVSGNTLWLVWHCSGVFLPGGTAAGATLRVFPTVDIGAGPQIINNAQLLGLPNFVSTGEVDVNQGFALAGTAAIKLISPPSPPIVQLYYSLVSDNTGTITDIAGILPVEGGGSCWLTAAELAAAAVFQLPPEVVLSPLT